MVVNFIILFIAYGLSLWVFRRWIRGGSFKNVSLTPQRMRQIAFRTALLYLFLGWICWYYQLNAFKLFGLIAGFSLLLLIAGGGFSLIGPFAGIPIIIYYVLFQWLLGFPDKELLIPPNERYKHPEPQPTYLIERQGSVETPLRPIGEISIDGQRHVATSEIDFIETGASITVVGVKNSTLVVRENPPK